MKLLLSDGTVAGTLVVEDGDANDQDLASGSILYIGPVGANWFINITSGLSTTAAGSAIAPHMDIGTLNFSSQDQGALTIELTDTGFLSAGVATANIGGNTDGSVTYRTWIDAGNGEFQKTTLLTSTGPFSTGAFDGTAAGIVDSVTPYSLTLETVIEHPFAGVTGFDAELIVTPCTGRIGDFVWADLNGNGCQDAGEPGIPGVQVDLYAGCFPNAVFLKSTFTDGDGKYLFDGLCAGSYSVSFHTPAGYTPTLANQSCSIGGKPADETDSDCDCAGGTPCSICVILPANDTQNLTIDCGYVKTCPQCVDPIFQLGAAAGCTVLQLTAHKVSITGPAGGILGDVCIAPKGSLSMSGDEYVTGAINLGPGAIFANSSHGTVNVVQNVDLSASIAAAYGANTAAANTPCTQIFSKLDGKTVTTISGGAGLNVICVGDISLSGKQITLTGPAGAKFLFNVTGKFVLTGGGAGPQIRVAPPLMPKDVLYNIIGTGSDVAFSGGGGGVDCCQAIVDGTLLAPYRKINLAPGLVNGQIISGLDISIVSGSSVRCPPCP